MTVRLPDVQTAEAFMECLRNYRALRGKPGYRDMAVRCHQARTATTIREALVCDELPNLPTLTAILDGLLAGDADKAAFVQARERLISAAVVAEVTGR